MRAFALVLMAAVAAFGIDSGYRLITGEELVNWERFSQAEPDLPASPIPTSAPMHRPTALPTRLPATPTPTPGPQAEFEPWWAQSQVETALWSGSDDGAVSFGMVPPLSYFHVASPQEGARLYVYNPATQNYAYIDAAAVRPSSAPPELAEGPDAEEAEVMLVGNTDGLGVYVRRTPNMGDRLRAWTDGTRMEVLERDIQSGGRQWMKVRSPDGAEGYVPAEYLVPGR